MFSVDVELLRSYGLPAQITELLVSIALWEIRSLLTGGLRLRTACDLEVIDQPKEPPQLSELTDRIKDLAPAAAGTPITALWER
jgi:CRISPR-associated protein Csb1